MSFTDDLVSGMWSNLVPDVVAAGPSALFDDASATNAAVRFYSIEQLD